MKYSLGLFGGGSDPQLQVRHMAMRINSWFLQCDGMLNCHAQHFWPVNHMFYFIFYFIFYILYFMFYFIFYISTHDLFLGNNSIVS